MEQGKTIRAALLGAGTVGGGVYKLANLLKEDIFQKTGARLEIDKVLVRDRSKKREGIPSEILTDRWEEIRDDDGIEIVIELMGGIHPALDYIQEALHGGKQVVTANKDLLAQYGAQLFEAAQERHCDLHFEASVAGAIPIIRPLRQSLAAAELTEVMGIVNGTTNYILTRMEKDGADFGTVLKEAQQKGYAERNPEADVEGYDACRKIAILTSLIAGRTVDFGEIHTEGITGITPEDFQYARAMGRTIKLLAVSREEEDGYLASVTPCMLKKEVPLALVNGVFNAVSVRGNTLGESMFYGKGAGKLPTASAVVSDVVDCARHLGEHMVCIWEDEPVRLKPFEEGVSRFFVRMKEESEAEADAVFGPVAKIRLRELSGEYGFLTEPMTEREFAGKHRKVSGMISRIRVRD